jgi:hypothetical protein
VQGGYGEKIPKSLKLRRDGAVDSESQESSDLHVVSCIGDSRVEAPKVVQQEQRYREARYPYKIIIVCCGGCV